MNSRLHDVLGSLFLLWLALFAGQAFAACEVERFRTCTGLPDVYNQYIGRQIAAGPRETIDVQCHTSGTTETCTYPNGGSYSETIVSQSAAQFVSSVILNNEPWYGCPSIEGQPDVNRFLWTRSGTYREVRNLDASGQIVSEQNVFSFTETFADGATFATSADITSDAQGNPTAGTFVINGIAVDAAAIRSCNLTGAVAATPAALTGLSITGGANVVSGGLLRLTTTASYSDSTSRSVNAGSWSVSPANFGSVNVRGELTAGPVTTDTPITVTAIYTEGGVTQTASFNITIKITPATLTSLAIVSPQVFLASGASQALSAESGYSDGSRKRVTPNWSVSGTAAGIGADGRLMANSVAQDTTIIVTASYTEGSQTATARFPLTIQPITVTPVLTAEVIASTNTQNLTSLQLWFNTQAQAAANRAGGQYKVFVAAFLPAGVIVPHPTFFMLNRSRSWQPLGWPLPEFLSGVNQGEWQLIDVLDAMDTSIISGTVFIVGYGVSDSEMLDAGRYQVVYRVP